MEKLTWRQVHRRRILRNHLLQPAPSSRSADVVRDVCGVHAQLLTAAELSVSARVTGITRREVHTELWKRRRLVKTYGPRGTLHLLPSDELPLWMAALRADPYWRNPRWLRSFRMTSDKAEAIMDAIGEALQDQCMTREQLGQEVARRVGSWATDNTTVVQFGGFLPIWGQLLGAAAYTGRLCFGPNRGNKVTFVRADQWVGGWKELDGREALAEVFRRYLAAYGPSTPEHFAPWFQLRPAEARRVMESIPAELVEVDVEGHRSWMLGSDAKAPAETASGGARLLPDYDCYIIGCAPPGYARESVVPKVAGNRVFGLGAGPYPTLLIDGVVAGVWKRVKRGRRIKIQVEPFDRLTNRHRAEVGAEVERIGEFLETEATLSFGARG